VRGLPNGRFLSVTDEVIRRHLSGKDDRGRDFAIGAYCAGMVTNGSFQEWPVSARMNKNMAALSARFIR
jgi:hypothetical protein